MGFRVLVGETGKETACASAAEAWPVAAQAWGSGEPAAVLGTLPAEEAELRALVSGSLRADEVGLLAGSPRCSDCHHLSALHNGHCCSFCTVPGCACKSDGSSDGR